MNKYSWGATFYGKRKDKLGTLVFKDDITKEILLWKHIRSELAIYYKHLLNQLLELGYIIQSVIVDGKRGLYKVFKDYPIQMCHFHQKKTIRRYITKNTRLQAGKDLKKILYNFNKTNEKNFTKKLYQSQLKYKSIPLIQNPIITTQFFSSFFIFQLHRQ